MKLEGVYNKAIFLAPKVYALKNIDESIVKIKGLSKESFLKYNITIETLETLLTKDKNLQFAKNKWFKHIDKGRISILNTIYILKVKGNKRKLIYDSNNILINTCSSPTWRKLPFIIDNKKTIVDLPPSSA